MKHKFAHSIEAMAMPCIVQLNRRRMALEAQGIPVLNAGQAIPDFLPPEAALKDWKSAMELPQSHGYTADEGLASLRAAVARSLCRDFGYNAVGEEEILITAGANHAFTILCTLLLEPGSAVGLLSPYFLNHQMAVKGSGGRVVEIAPDGDFNYAGDHVERAVEAHQLRAIAVVNPSNPTGKVFTGPELAGLMDLCKRHQIYFICDEVYRSFVYPPQTMVSAGSLPGAGEETITFGSFSKEFGMTGWRVGWIRASRTLISQLVKVQDYSLICAPHASQLLALSALEQVPHWSRLHLENYHLRKRAVCRILEGSGIFQIYEGGGAFFVWFRPLAETVSLGEVFQILEEKRVCLLPGSLFGEMWQCWYRLSFGNLDAKALCRATEAIVSYFSRKKTLTGTKTPSQPNHQRDPITGNHALEEKRNVRLEINASTSST